MHNARTTSAEVIATAMTITHSSRLLRLRLRAVGAGTPGSGSTSRSIGAVTSDIGRHASGARCVSPGARSERSDQLLDPLVPTAQRVLAQHGALGLVVELEGHPIDGVVALALLGPLDELTAQPGSRRLRRLVDRHVDVRVRAHP